MRLGWSSLTFAPDTDAMDELRRAWAWLLKEDYAPILFSVLGDMFLEVAATGEIRWLNTGTGDVQRIADSADQFRALLGTDKANEWFLPGLWRNFMRPGKSRPLGSATPTSRCRCLWRENMRSPISTPFPRKSTLQARPTYCAKFTNSPTDQR